MSAISAWARKSNPEKCTRVLLAFMYIIYIHVGQKRPRGNRLIYRVIAVNFLSEHTINLCLDDKSGFKTS